MIIKNNTHYYSIFNKTYNVVPDNDSWEYESSRRMSYEQRLYWEYRYIKSVGGQAFFYTFTYNNKSLPTFSFEDIDINGNSFNRTVPCFNYEHIRLITNGLISKHLRRRFGSQVRYFVACERGEGKGKRGKGKNPHYHVIFFISPLPADIRKPNDPPYKRISPIQFCHLCKCVWQYQTVDNSYKHLAADYRSARFGHCQPGDDLGLVTDFDALSYVSKYVCKDASLSSDDKAIKAYYHRYFNSLGYTWHSIYFYYQYMRLNDLISDRAHFLEASGIGHFIDWRSRYPKLRHKFDLMLYLTTYYWYEVEGFWKQFKEFFTNIYIPYVVSQSYRNYYNKFGSKVRTSKSLGIYGLNFVQDEINNPHFIMNTDEVKPQPICLYYYRRIYMDVVHCPVTGNPLYVLNQKGIDLKCRNLGDNIDKLYIKLLDCFSFFDVNRNNEELWSMGSLLDLTKERYDDLIHSVQFNECLSRFAVYRQVYKYRHYSKFEDDVALSSGFTLHEFELDYRRFLSSNFYTCDYDGLYLLRYIDTRNHYLFGNSILSFDSHPAFIDYSHMFDQIESFYQVYLQFKGNIKKHEFAESAHLRMRINSLKYTGVNVM